MIWALNEFLERVCVMRETYHDYLSTKKAAVYEDEAEDPFFIDTSKPSEIGEARIFLEPLVYLFDVCLV